MASKEIQLIIKDYEQLDKHTVKLWCTDIAKLRPVEYELHFNDTAGAIDKIVDALRWRKVVYLSHMYRW